MNESKPIAAYRKHIPVRQQAELDALPEKMTVAELAKLHPWGDDFAKLLLAAHDVFLEHEAARAFGPENCPPPDPKFGKGLRGESLEGWELLDIVLHFPHEEPWEPIPSVGDPRNALLISVHRDDLKAWLQEVELWPLQKDAALNLWWKPQVAPKSDRPSERHSAAEATAIKARSTRVRDLVTVVVRECCNAYHQENGEYPKEAYQCLDWLGNRWKTKCGIEWLRKGREILVDGETCTRERFNQRFRYVRRKLTGT